MIGRTVIQVAVGFSGSRLSGVSDYQPKWVAQLTVSDHGDLRLDLGNNRKREKTKRDALEQREQLHTDHRIILHAPHERYCESIVGIASIRASSSASSVALCSHLSDRILIPGQPETAAAGGDHAVDPRRRCIRPNMECRRMTWIAQTDTVNIMMNILKERKIPTAIISFDSPLSPDDIFLSLTSVERDEFLDYFNEEAARLCVDS